MGSAAPEQGQKAVGGITVSGEYTVSAIVDANSYEIVHASAASSGATGGGASVAYEYEIACGYLVVTRGGGYGVGGYGQGTYGTVRTDSDFIQFPRIWTFSGYGEDALATYNGGKLYYYDATNPTDRATVVSNSPSSMLAAFVTDERHIIALGTSGDLMNVEWCDQNDSTLWTPASTNTAGSRRLRVGTRLVNGAVLQGRENLIWSDEAVYLWQYTGSQYVFDSRVAGTKCGLVAPHAFAVFDGVAYWMSPTNFHLYNGAVQPIPNSSDVRKWVFDNISDLQRHISFAGYYPEFSEVWWWFALEGDSDCSVYVAYNTLDGSWTKGTMSRSAFTLQDSVSVNPILSGVTGDSYLYKHEQSHKNDDSGAAIEAFVTAAPLHISYGSKVIDMWGFDPDFETQVGDVTLEIVTYGSRRTADVVDNLSYTIETTDTVIDTHASGRFMAMTLRSNAVDGDFRIGQPTINTTPGGDR